jgi:hypothetical protein
MTPNGFRLGVVADLETLHRQPSTNVDLKNYRSIYHIPRNYARPPVASSVFVFWSVS